MALFNKGDKVIRVSSKERGIIVSIGPCGRGGRQLYIISFNGEEVNELEGNLMLDYNIDDPFECCKNKIYGSFSDFSKSNTSFKIRNSNINTISSLKASKTLFRAYQYKPLLKFLNSDNKRILVADEVGLGKTIEAGHIILELKARNEFRNALIVCPISLQDKWKEELQDKFGLTFSIVEHKRELIRMLKDNDGMVRAIINYEKIRSIKIKERGENKKEEKEEKEGNELLEYLQNNNKSFSLVLCDEAHKLRNDNTQTYKGAKLIMQNTDAAIFLTATPIMISEQNLYNLLHLLDEQRYSNYAIFAQGLRENAPFVRALSELSTKKALPQIAEDLAESEIQYLQVINEQEYKDTGKVKEYFKDFPLFQRIMRRMAHEEDSLLLRSQLQHDIVSMSPMNQIFSRTRKREVTTDWSQAERHPHKCVVPLYPEERIEFDRVIEEYIDDNSYTDIWGEQKLTQGGALGLVQRKRQVASSVYAYLNNYESLQHGLDKYYSMPDSKVDELLKVVKAVFDNGQKKLIVFALFKKTLYYLAIRLKAAGYRCAMIHGDVADRQTIIDQFHYSPDVQILLSSEVGSEGLDMQFCNSMVNYDLPWNPMVVEQRIGRIDRFGQEAPIVNIYNLVVKDSIQEDIYDRLLERIGIFRSSIGDMEAILDAEIEGGQKGISIQSFYSEMEKEFFCKQLTREEIQRKIDEIARAIINEKDSIRRLEEDMTNALTNDAYFRNEINRIQNNNAYITAIELKNYIEMLLKEGLPTCSLNRVDEKVYELQMPKSNKNLLYNFLSEYQPVGDEYAVLFRQFRSIIRDEEVLRITFDQEEAYNHKNLIFLNMYNPIVIAAYKYFSQSGNGQSKTFAFSLNKSHLQEITYSKGYLLAIYQIETKKNIFGIEKTSSTQYPILFDVDKQLIVDDEELISAFMGKIQVMGEYRNFSSSEFPDTDSITEAQISFAEKINTYHDEYLGEMMLQAENSALLQKQQTEAYYKYRIDNRRNALRKAEEEKYYALISNDTKALREAEGAARLQESNLIELEQKRDEKLKEITKDQNIRVRTSLLSINFVKID